MEAAKQAQAPVVHTFETTAWLTSSYSASPEDLLQGKALNSIAVSQHDMTDCGWTRVGKATVTVELLSQDAMVEAKVDALQAELQTARAEFSVKESRIQEQIQNLLAITYTPEAA